MSFPRGKFDEAEKLRAAALFDVSAAVARKRKARSVVQPVKKKKVVTDLGSAAELTKSGYASVFTPRCLDYYDLHLGSLVVGCIAEVGEKLLRIWLPFNLVADCHWKNAIDFQDFAGRRLSAPTPRLDQVFQVGQFVMCAILQAPKGSRLDVCLRPSILNSNFHKVPSNSVVPANVVSLEDHGYQLSLGQGTTGFLPQEAGDFQVGQILLVRTAKKGWDLQLEKPRTKPVETLENLAIGSLVEATVTEVLPAAMSAHVRHKKADTESQDSLKFWGPGGDKGIIGGCIVSFWGFQAFLHTNYLQHPDMPKYKTVPRKGTKLLVRVIAILPETRQIQVAVLPHLLKLSSETENPPAPALPIGAKVDAKVFDVQWSLIRLRTRDSVFVCSKQRLADEIPQKTTDICAMGANLPARLLDYNPFDRVGILSCQPKILDQPIISVHQLELGQLVRVKLVSRQENFFICQINEFLTGTLDFIHLTNFPSEEVPERFQEGTKLKTRVLALDYIKNRVRLTAKKMYVNMEDEDLIRKDEDLVSGKIVWGFVSRASANKHGCRLVQFFGGASGFLQAIKSETEFAPGTLVKCQVVKGGKGTQRPQLTLDVVSLSNGQEHPQSMEAGTLVCRLQAQQIHEAGVVVGYQLDGQKMVGLIPKPHLSDVPEFCDLFYEGIARKLQANEEVGWNQGLTMAQDTQGPAPELSLVSVKPTLVAQQQKGVSTEAEGTSVYGYLTKVDPLATVACLGVENVYVPAKLRADYPDLAVGQTVRGLIKLKDNGTKKILELRESRLANLPQASDVDSLKQSFKMMMSICAPAIFPGAHLTGSLQAEKSYGLLITIPGNSLTGLVLTRNAAHFKPENADHLLLIALDFPSNGIVHLIIVETFETKPIVPKCSANLVLKKPGWSVFFYQNRVFIGPKPTWNTSQAMNDGTGQLVPLNFEGSQEGIHFVSRWKSPEGSSSSKLVLMPSQSPPQYYESLGVQGDPDQFTAPADLDYDSRFLNTRLYAEVRGVRGRYLTVAFEDDLYGRIPLLHLSDDPNLLKGLPDHLNIGDYLGVTLIGHSSSGFWCTNLRETSAVWVNQLVDLPGSQLTPRLGWTVCQIMKVAEPRIPENPKEPMDLTFGGVVAYVHLPGDRTGVLKVTRVSSGAPSSIWEFLQVGAFHKCQIIEEDEEATSHVEVSLIPFEKPVALKKGQKLRGYPTSVSPKAIFIKDLATHQLCYLSANQLGQNQYTDFSPGLLVENLTVIWVDPKGLEFPALSMAPKSKLKVGQQPGPLSWSDLSEGGIVRGEVQTIKDFGLFIDVYGTQSLVGLVHKSEVSDTKSVSLESFQVGHKVVAKILQVSSSTLKLTLRKSQMEDQELVALPAVEDEDAMSLIESDSEILEPQTLAAQPEVQVAEVNLEKPVAPPQPLQDGQSSDDELFEGLTPIKPKKTGTKLSANQQEKELRRLEKRDGLRNSEVDTPQSAQDFEKLLVSSQEAQTWIEYMAFHIKVGDLEATRKVAERGISQLSYDNEEERQQVWLAYLNFEACYGDNFEAIFQRALKYNDPKSIFIKMGPMYENFHMVTAAKNMYSWAFDKFPTSRRTILPLLIFLFKEKQFSEARDVYRKALTRVPTFKLVDIKTKMGSLEYRAGNFDQGTLIFQGIFSETPGRMDVWAIFLDEEERRHTPPTSGRSPNLAQLRQIYSQAVNLKLKPHSMKFLFNRYLGFEEKWGTPETQTAVKEKALAYVSDL